MASDVQLSRQLVASALICLAWGAAGAQTMPRQYQMTQQLKPVLMSGVAQDSQPRSINGRGQVAGWVNQAAGTVSKWTIYDTGANPLAWLTGWVNAKFNAIQVSPVIWTQGVPRVITRYGSSTSTWVRSFTNDDGLLVALAMTSGKTAVDIGLGRRPYVSPPNDTRVALWSAGRYTLLASQFDKWSDMKANSQGAVAGTKNNLPVLYKDGLVTPITLPNAAMSSSIRAINDADQVLLQSGSCLVWQGGTVTEISPPDIGRPVVMTCDAINAAGDVAGVVEWTDQSATSVRKGRAVFRWRKGQMTVSTFEEYEGTSLAQYRVFLDDSGVVTYSRRFSQYVPYESFVFTSGEPVALKSLIAFSDVSFLGSNELQIWSVNQSGQMLVGPGNDSAQALPVVLTPGY